MLSIYRSVKFKEDKYFKIADYFLSLGKGSLVNMEIIKGYTMIRDRFETRKSEIVFPFEANPHENTDKAIAFFKCSVLFSSPSSNINIIPSDKHINYRRVKVEKLSASSTTGQVSIGINSVFPSPQKVINIMFPLSVIEN